MLLGTQIVAQLGNKDASPYASQLDELTRASDAAMAKTLDEVARCLSDFEQRLQCEFAFGTVYEVRCV